MADNLGVKLPKGITLDSLVSDWDTSEREYAKALKKAVVLDAADRGRIWEALKVKFPKYQMLPDTNDVTYVKVNLMASLYTLGKYSNILPTSEKDKDIVEHLNVAIQHEWNTCDIAKYQMLAGERAALLNIGVTQVGWDQNAKGGSANTNSYYKGKLALKNLNPLRYRRDPFAEDLDTAAYAIYWDDFHKSVFQRSSLYAAEFKKYYAIHTAAQGAGAATNITIPLVDVVSKHISMPKDYFRLITYWIRNEDSVSEIHVINNEYVLYVNESVKPDNMIPIVELFCNVPVGDVIGTSEPAKIFSNTVVYNLMNSIMATAEYKNQRPPRFVNAAAGLNVNAFKKYGNEADHTFIVNGDASRAVHYHQFPQVSPQVSSLMNGLAYDIKRVTGVDERYTGRDTGSIITTGGTEAMLDQVTMVDQPKINNYNDYSKRLTKLVVMNLAEHSAKREYYIKVPDKNEWKTITVDFPKFDVNTLLDYQMDVTSELPKNKQRMAQFATVLMEKQLQYRQAGMQVDLITPEEWLQMQDLPNREYMLERMGIQRNQDYIDMAAQIVFQYAALTEAGMNPEEALIATAETVKNSRQPQQFEEPQVQAPGPGQTGLPPLEI